MIRRDPSGTSAERYDIIVVGGGIYGCALALESARRNMRPLLIERDDFGQHTSWNSLRIVHGGLRYLQSLDLKRYFESVAERRWFLIHFPDLVQPLPCLMPLYGSGLRRPSVFAAALAVDALLSRGHNDGIQRPDRRLPRGRVLTSEATTSRFPALDFKGLRGGGLWYDAAMPDSQRVIIEILHWAVASGATALNYLEAEQLLVRRHRVEGIVARDVQSGSTHEFRAPVVVTCCGPWSRDTARRFDRDAPELFQPSIALNLLLDVEPPFDTAVALSGKRDGSRALFLYPWKGRVLAGTYHAPGDIDLRAGEQPLAEAERFLADLREVVPGMGLSPDKVARIFWGLLPAKAAGTADLSVREVVLDHASRGGPEGLYSVSGVKFTMARRVAEKTLGVIERRRGARPPTLALAGRPTVDPPPPWTQFSTLMQNDPIRARAIVARIVDEESVLHLSDLVLRRTDWGLSTLDAESAEELVRALWADDSVDRPKPLDNRGPRRRRAD